MSNKRGLVNFDPLGLTKLAGGVYHWILTYYIPRKKTLSASSKPTTEFAQPRLSRVKRGRPQRGGTNLGVCFSYMAGHYPGILMTGHIGTNTPKFLPPSLGMTALWSYSKGAVQIRVGLELTDPVKKRGYITVTHGSGNDYTINSPTIIVV